MASAGGAQTGADPGGTGIRDLVAGAVYLADEANGATLRRCRSSNRPGRTDLYLSSGLYDAFGNFEGTRMLAERAAGWGARNGTRCTAAIVQ
jgi:hypothetical protein